MTLANLLFSFLFKNYYSVITGCLENFKKKVSQHPLFNSGFPFLSFFFPSYLLHKHLLKKQVLMVPDTLDILPIAGNKKQHLLNFWSCFLLFLLSFYLIY